MTQIDSQASPTTYLYYLINPATGAHNVVVSAGGSTIITACSASYTGAKQSAQPDAHTKAASNTTTLTVSHPGSWIVATCGDSAGLGVGYAAGPGFTFRNGPRVGGYGNGLEDSNAVAFTGSDFPSTGLVSGYKFDINSNDYVGSNSGSDTAISYSTAGIVRTCATFNGTSSQIDLGTSTNLNFTSGDFSFSFWLNPADYGYSWLYTKGTLSANGIFIDKLDTAPSGSIRIFFNQGGAYQFVSTSNTIPTGQWTHVVITRSGTAVHIYFNNVEVVYTHNVGDVINPITTTNHAFIGSANGGSFYKGSIDEFGIWSRAITAAEISTLYNAGAGYTINPITASMTLTSGTPGAIIVASIFAQPITNTLAFAVTTYALTFISFLLTKQKKLTFAVTSYILTMNPFNLTKFLKKWSNTAKNNSSWNNQSKS